MKNYKIKYFVLFVVFLTCFNVSAQTLHQWDEFLIKPNDNTFIALENYISNSQQKCSWGNPSNSSVISSENRKQLFELISNGNESAFRAGLLVEKCMDGGDLEDFYRSSGLFFEKNPYVFIKTVKDRAVSASSIEYMLTMLPLDSVDNLDRQLFIINNRISLLKKVDEDSFKEILNIGSTCLRREKNSILNK